MSLAGHALLASLTFRIRQMDLSKYGMIRALCTSDSGRTKQLMVSNMCCKLMALTLSMNTRKANKARRSARDIDLDRSEEDHSFKRQLQAYSNETTYLTFLILFTKSSYNIAKKTKVIRFNHFTELRTSNNIQTIYRQQLIFIKTTAKIHSLCLELRIRSSIII